MNISDKTSNLRSFLYAILSHVDLIAQRHAELGPICHSIGGSNLVSKRCAELCSLRHSLGSAYRFLLSVVLADIGTVYVADHCSDSVVWMGDRLRR